MRGTSRYVGLPDTFFHCVVTCIARMLKERPLMNRFVSRGITYERNEIAINFTAKRHFSDGAEESLMTITAKDDDTLDTISRQIYGDVNEIRKTCSVFR